MRRFLFSALLVASLTGPGLADESGIQSVISSQIQAFQADDFETAFTYASPTIKRLFGSLDYRQAH